MQALNVAILGVVSLAFAGFSGYVLMNQIRRFGEFVYGAAPAMFTLPFFGLAGVGLVVLGITLNALVGLSVFVAALLVAGFIGYGMRKRIAPWFAEWWQQVNTPAYRRKMSI